MKKLKEIFKRVVTAIPGAHTPETLEEAQSAIVQDSSYLSTLRRWGTNIGVTALALGGLALFAKSGIVLVPALAVGGLFAAVHGGIALLKRNLRTSREAEHKFITDLQNAPDAGMEPSPGVKPGAELGTAFKAKADLANENAVRIKALEKQLADLETAAAQKRKQKELGLGG